MFFNPPSPINLPVPLIRQRRPGECLVACVAMLYASWNIRFSYDELKTDLRIRPNAGSPLENVRQLSPKGFAVYFQRRGTFANLYGMLERGWPSIVSVQAGEFPYWQEPPTQHAVVVVGMIDDNILVNDPTFADAPLAIPYGDFDLAWLEMDEAFAVIAPA
ncbi:MAG: C39 family peptidase [Chloroflexi bacterium]|nr:C39 family peptidase [Chloroflexota bacterium]